MPARLLYTNNVMNPAFTLSVSSEDSGSPRGWLRDEARGLRWRSGLGWNVVAGVNDKIDFNRGGVKVATVASGNYATAASMGAAVLAAIQTADAVPTWGVFYNSTSHVFTIYSSTHAFTLLFGTGANIATSAGPDLGYSAVDLAATLVVNYDAMAQSASYKSREWIKVDCLAATSVTCAVVLDHNLGAGGTVKLQANATDAWGSPSVSETLAGDATVRVGYFAGGSYRYRRILIDDVSSNTAGYTEVGIAYAGTYTEPSVTYSTSFEKGWEELSAVSIAISGAHRRDARPRRPVYSMSWAEVLEADRAKLAAWAAAAPLGACTFLGLSPTVTPTDIVYGYFVEGLREGLSTNLYWTLPLRFAGALP